MKDRKNIVLSQIYVNSFTTKGNKNHNTSTCGCGKYFLNPVLAGIMAEKETIEVIISEIDLYVINKVREIRVPKNLSQVKLSILIGLAEGAIGKIENPKERAKYNIRHLNLLAKALNCSPRDFLPEKPLKNDLVKVRLRIKRSYKPGEPNFEILKIEPVKE